MAWWHNNQRRLKAERIAIEELEASSDWLKNVEWSLDNRLCLRVVFDICLEHRSFRLQVTYHNTYPSSPPSVAPIENIHLSYHQYGKGGDLCLQIRPDNWNPDSYTGSDMIQSAYNLLVIEAPNDDGKTITAPSDHDVPDGIAMRRESYRLYLSAATQRVLTSDVPDRAKVKLWFHYYFQHGHFNKVALVHKIEKDDFSWSPPDVPKALAEHTHLHDGIIIHTQLDGVTLSRISNEDELASIVGADLVPSSDEYHFLVVSSDGSIVLFGKRQETFSRYATILQPCETACRSGDEAKKLSAQCVGIVGLGSLGSKVAASLARAGVGNFVLIDGDILHAGNIERHDADWRDIGLHKVDIMARRLHFLSPHVNCDSRRTMIGAQVSSEEAGNVSTALSKCTLVIDATAEAEVFNHLAGLVTMSNATLVWGAVYAGGVGCEIGRSRPSKDPSPFHIRNAINQAYDNTGNAALPEKASRSYAGEKNDLVLVATDAEVSAAASLMAKLSLDALFDRDPSRYDAHAYLVGYARGWMFEGPFHVQPIISDAPLRANETQPIEEFSEKEFVNSLVLEKVREIENSSQNS